MEKEIVFIRADLNKVGGHTAYYRMTREMREFLNLVLKKHGKIQAITLDFENNEYGWNIGFIIAKPEKKKTKNGDQREQPFAFA